MVSTFVSEFEKEYGFSLHVKVYMFWTHRHAQTYARMHTHSLLNPGAIKHV